MQKAILASVCLLLAGCSNLNFSPGAGSGDAEFNRVSEEYIAGYLAWRPQSGTSLGLHEYDGKVTDFSRASIDGERDRLRRSDATLRAMDTRTLSPQAFYDYRILS